MKMGAIKALLPWSLEEADLSFCLQGNYGWDAAEALAPMTKPATVADTVDKLVAAVASLARPGDHVLVMSNGAFGGIHGKLLQALAARAR
jgi:UDP-N-acetylmuramate: L-alanyl-gamma-D-glutamyl-meso-diaminopimelate ligase